MAIRDLEFYSGISIDKIIFAAEGTIQANDFSVASKTVTHNLGRKVYPVLYWTADGSTYYSGETVRTDVPGVQGDVQSYVWPENDTNQCIIYFENRSGGQQTITFSLSLIEREVDL